MKFIGKLYLEITKKEWPIYLGFLIILLISLVLTEPLFFDDELIKISYPGGYNDMPTNAYNILYPLYSNGFMGLQGYLFGFAFFLLLIFIFTLFSLYISLKMFKKDVSILKVKNVYFLKSNGLYFFITAFNYLILFILSVPILYIINLILNTINDINVNIYSINYATIITLIVLYFFVITSYLLMYVNSFKVNKLIKNIREIF